MRSLLQAIILAPAAIVSAFVLPFSKRGVHAESKQNSVDTTGNYKTKYYLSDVVSNVLLLDGRTLGLVPLDIFPDSTSAEMFPLELQIEILPSTEACGLGNVTIDRQTLSQTFDPETLVSSGRGSISTSKSKIIVGSWSFDCIMIEGKPNGQLMKFMIDFIDGKSIENAGFSVLFRQSGDTEIMHIEMISSQEDQLIVHHSPDKYHHNGDGPAGEHKHHIGHGKFDIHNELAKLRYMQAQLKELKYLIHEKKRHISKHVQDHHNIDQRIRDCDSIRCIARVFGGRARKFYGNLVSDDSGEGYFYHSLESLERGKKFGQKSQGQPGHHTPGNSTFEEEFDSENNHIRPPLPPFHRHHNLPVCHYPPPFDSRPHGPHHDAPPGPPPEPPHRPHHDGPFGPPGPPQHHFGPPEFERPRYPGKHPFHDNEEHGPWERHHRRPDEGDFERGDRFHEGHDEPSRNDGPRNGGEEFDKEFERLPGNPHHGERPPPFEEHHDRPSHERPIHELEHGEPHHPHDHKDFEAQEPAFDGPSHESLPHEGPTEDRSDFDGPPPHDEPHPGPRAYLDGPPSEHGPPPPGPPPLPFHILKPIVIGFLLSILILALCRRAHNHKTRSGRRGYHTTKHASFKSRWVRITGNDKDFEEKDRSLDDCDSDGDSDNESIISVGRDLSSFRNAADVVGDMVAAEEGRGMASPISSMPPHLHSLQPQVQIHPTQASMSMSMSMSSIPHFDGYSNDNIIDDSDMEEVLPAYEESDYDLDGSEEDSLVSDGFRYMPGGGGYSPNSGGGDVGDVLGDKR